MKKTTDSSSLVSRNAAVAATEGGEEKNPWLKRTVVAAAIGAGMTLAAQGIKEGVQYAARRTGEKKALQGQKAPMPAPMAAAPAAPAAQA